MNSKKTSILFLSTMLINLGVYAQKSKVLSAYNYERAYRRDKDCGELQKGVNAIEPAIKDDKTKDEAKTWYYRGNLYFDISIAKDKACQNIDLNATEKAFNSYVKAMKLGFKDTTYHHLDIENKQADAQKFFMGYIGALQGKVKVEDATWYQDIALNKFPYLENQYYNKGVQAFSKKQDYKTAYEDFSKATLINGFSAPLTKKIDTTAYYNAALAAQNCKDPKIQKNAVQLYKVLIKMGYRGQGATPYLSLSDLQMAQGDEAAAQATIEDGRKAMPKNNALIRKMVDFDLKNGKDTDALNNLNLALQQDSKNAVLLYARGTVYDKMKNYDKAEADYKASLADSSNYFDANYNLGALYFNKGADYNNQANKVPIGQNAKAKALQDKAQAEFKKAQPYLEKAHRLNPNDNGVLTPLLKIYAMTDQTEKYKALKATLK